MLNSLWHGGLRTARLGLAVGFALALAGCDSLVEYEERDVLPPTALNNAAGANALYVGALSQFGQAFAGDGGGTEGQALIAGLMSDEFFHSGTFSTRVDYDMRATALDNSTLEGVFRNLQTARIDALRAVDAMLATGAAAGSDARIGAMYVRVGALFLYAAQNYCSGIPFTGIVGGAPVYGQQLTTVQMLDSADVYFDKALAAAAGTNSVNHNTARVLKARGLQLRGTGQFGAASTLVASVPTTFVAVNEHSEALGSTQNGIFVFNVQNERWSLAHREGVNGLPFRGADPGTDNTKADPRVPWKRDPGDVGFDNSSPQYDLQIYKTRKDNSRFTSGIEARLIEAEAALQAGNTATWLSKLNELRATVAGLAPLTDPGTSAARVDMMFSERAFWLFATGTRLSDMRRMVKQYGRAATSVFPVGAYPKGGSYGTDVNFPVPSRENQNPNFSAGIACIDRNA